MCNMSGNDEHYVEKWGKVNEQRVNGRERDLIWGHGWPLWKSEIKTDLNKVKEQEAVTFEEIVI